MVMGDIRYTVPDGLFRVVFVDMFDDEVYLVGDYDEKEEALRIAELIFKDVIKEYEKNFVVVYDDKGEIVKLFEVRKDETEKE